MDESAATIPTKTEPGVAAEESGCPHCAAHKARLDIIEKHLGMGPLPPEPSLAESRHAYRKNRDERLNKRKRS